MSAYGHPANKEGYSSLAKGLGGCAAVGTFFSVLDAARNPTFGNFTSVCIFGFASWALLAGAVRMKQPNFVTLAPEQASETIVGWKLGAPPWVGVVTWIGLFLVLMALAAEIILNRSELHLTLGGT